MPLGRPATGRTQPLGGSLYFGSVNAEFNWWLLIVGLVVGAGLMWFVLLDGRRREDDVDALERPREAAWLSAALAEEGRGVSPETVERVLRLHRAYLEAPPPDDPGEGGSAGASPGRGGAPGAFAAGAGPSELADDDRLRVERRPPDIGQ